MPRPPRIHAPGAFDHVTLRGNHQQPVFFRDSDRDLLDHIVAQSLERLAARLHAYCWMTNHLHMLVQVSDAPLGRLMLRIASTYARKVQTRLETSGHLFERRYHASLVDADSHLLAISDLVQYQAVRLFIDRVRLYQPDFTLGADNAPAVAQICSRLDGIPLALEMAAAWVNALTVEEIAVRLSGPLDARFQMLNSATRTISRRQNTLRATMEWSYALLTAAEQRLLKRLSFFPAVGR